MPPITAQDDLGEVYELLRRPAQSVLPWQDALKSLSRQYVRRNKEFQLSDKNWFLRSVPLNPNSAQELLNVDDYSVPVKVTMRNRNAQPDDDWYPVEVVNADVFEHARIEGRPAITIFGTPPQIAYAMDITDQSFTLWYEPSATRPALLTDVPEIEPDFNTLLVYDTALECGGLARDDTKEYYYWWKDHRIYLAAQIEKWEAVMKKWINLARGQGRAYKRGYPFSNRPHMPEFRRR